MRNNGEATSHGMIIQYKKASSLNGYGPKLIKAQTSHRVHYVYFFQNDSTFPVKKWMIHS